MIYADTNVLISERVSRRKARFDGDLRESDCAEDRTVAYMLNERGSVSSGDSGVGARRADRFSFSSLLPPTQGSDGLAAAQRP